MLILAVGATVAYSVRVCFLIVTSRRMRGVVRIAGIKSNKRLKRIFVL